MSTTGVMYPRVPAPSFAGEPEFDPMAPRATRQDEPPSLLSQRGTGTILIAEDHEDSRDALRTLLDAFGYQVHEAVNGREAVERALAVNPDLILMDMMMPEVDGFEATRRLRATPGFRQVPIIALTAMEGARERVMAAGCDDFLCKPLDVRSFLERVRNWMTSSRAAS
jgi:CheY-like chemotaxis protein